MFDLKACRNAATRSSRAATWPGIADNLTVVVEAARDAGGAKARSHPHLAPLVLSGDRIEFDSFAGTRSARTVEPGVNSRNVLRLHEVVGREGAGRKVGFLVLHGPDAVRTQARRLRLATASWCWSWKQEQRFRPARGREPAAGRRR